MIQCLFINFVLSWRPAGSVSFNSAMLETVNKWKKGKSTACVWVTPKTQFWETTSFFLSNHFWSVFGCHIPSFLKLNYIKKPVQNIILIKLLLPLFFKIMFCQNMVLRGVSSKRPHRFRIWKFLTYCYYRWLLKWLILLRLKEIVNLCFFVYIFFLPKSCEMVSFGFLRHCYSIFTIKRLHWYLADGPRTSCLLVDSIIWAPVVPLADSFLKFSPVLSTISPLRFF